MGQLRKLPNLLLEGNYTRSVSEVHRSLTYPDFIELFETYCNQYDFNQTPILRGWDQEDYELNYMFDPRYLKRKSANTNNICTLLIDGINLELNLGFPLRQKSLICTSSYTKVKDFSADSNCIFVVIPFNNSKIGVCHRSDIWYSFPKIAKSSFETIHSVDEYGTGVGATLSDINNVLEVFGGGRYVTTYSKLKRLLQAHKVNKSFKEDYISQTEINDDIAIDEYMETFRKLKNELPNNATIFDFVKAGLNLKENGNWVVTQNELNKVIKKNSINGVWGQEIWIDSPSLLIHIDEYHRFEKKYKKS